jgi:hypothetical protein
MRVCDPLRHAPNVAAAIAGSLILPRQPWDVHSVILCPARREAQPDGAVQPDRCQWVCRGSAQSRRRGLCAVHATSGSTLDGVLSRRKNRRHRWTAHPHRSATRGAGDLRNGEQPAACGKRGQSPGVGPPTPWARTFPAHSPLRSWPWWSSSHTITLSVSGTSHLQLSILARARPALAGAVGERP